MSPHYYPPGGKCGFCGELFYSGVAWAIHELDHIERGEMDRETEKKMLEPENRQLVPVVPRQ